MACCKRRLRSTTLNKEMEIQENDASSGVPIAPTASLRNQRKLEEIKMLEMKLEFQNEKIKELREDNIFLKEQLAAALKKTDPGPSSSSYSLVSSDTSNIERDSVEATSSNDTSSNDISPNDTSSDEKKKNKRIKKRKDRTLALKYCQRAQDPKQVVARYKKILKIFKRSGTMSQAFKKYGVDRNTVIITSPIAELYVVAPEKYKEIMQTYSKAMKLSVFAAQCALAISEDADIEQKIQTLKDSRKLIPFKTK
ncbi:coiled-coil domain-containing protein 106-like [Boleophthalmus pectinirostris]|uniref:coiled-coil domain-containing protein 106-like n=1 Tax=Boleophthalmus pectinirostris TaxID=150288 RepID=UPI0024311261|nr:coiled-coil domain-containing protein 106-like [Boleophthalmus pectinirostris]